MSASRLVRVALLSLLAGVGCLPSRNARSEAPAPTAASEWPTIYARAMADANESRIAAAERALAEFAQRYPGSPEAAEVTYWRALLKLDPTNTAATHEAVGMLEAYLAGAPAGTHRLEATTLHRLALALEQRSAALAAVPATPAPRPEDKAREEELVRLREELSKANAELARIRRRLARPRP